MDDARDDVRAIETAADLLVRGLNRADISAVSDLVTENSMVLPPVRRTSKGPRALDFFRNLAMGNEAVQMLSTDLEMLAPGLFRDVGKLSMRQKRSGERVMFRYLALWQKTGDAWTLSTLSWNREQPAGGRQQGGGRRQGGGQGGAPDAYQTAAD